ncbi:MAG: valine--tRNA ligase [Bryobacteraceae bacterium]
MQLESNQLAKVYEPQRFEQHWAEWWIERGFFIAPARPTAAGQEVFSLVIPPPNVTGMLHIGHMLEHTEIDVTTRWHRMRGHLTLWLPGTDHAGIATQMVVERSLLENENLTRAALGREEFLRRVWQWKEQYGQTILKQMQRIGDSCDWSRNRFTMDQGLSRAVRETFVRLYEKGLIYRGAYMVNWCPRCHTALSDLEVVHEEAPGKLWHIRYPVLGLEGRSVVVATTRPETMLGDTAVAVNPDDERYADLHGRTVLLPLMDREIPVICDTLADPQFGTGVVKVTPAHDPNDFEAGRRHNLPHVVVIDKDGCMTAATGPFAGLDRYEARKAVLAHLEAEGGVVKTEDYTVSLGKCQRCGTVVEPLVSTQWFCSMKPLAAPAIKAVEDGRIVFVPENWSKTYFEWMYNIRDWCISRQLWWGHRIPAWHCPQCGGVTVAREAPQACAKCGSNNIEQDPDVLDTWFSSGLWPFSTLGWPDHTDDLKTYYPTTLLITGFDILFFWVARMIMLGLECMGDVPFRTVYIHGLVRDAERQKMSKTKGNVVDPLVVTEQYGTDAVRFALLRGAAPGTDIVFSEERLTSSRAFANKIWNAARFIFLHMGKLGVEHLELTECSKSVPEPLRGFGDAPIEDKWIFHRLSEVAEKIDQAQRTYRYHDVADLLYGFFWDEFCDWYVEIKKLRIQSEPEVPEHLVNLLMAFEVALRMLHPVMPFLSEELWQRLVKRDQRIPESLAIAPFPEPNPLAENRDAVGKMALLQEMVKSARSLRADQKLDPKQRFEGVLVAHTNAASELIAARQRAMAAGGGVTFVGGQLQTLEALTNMSFAVGAPGAEKATGASRSTPEFDVVLKLSGTQAAAMRQRLEKEIEQLTKVVENTRRQLGNEKFTTHAPPHVIQEMKAKLADYEAQIERSRAALGGAG